VGGRGWSGARYTKVKGSLRASALQFVLGPQLIFAVPACRGQLLLCCCGFGTAVPSTEQIRFRGDLLRSLSSLETIAGVESLSIDVLRTESSMAQPATE